MKVYIIDIAGWGLVGIAATLGAYACWLFETHVSTTLAKGITQIIYHIRPLITFPSRPM